MVLMLFPITHAIFLGRSLATSPATTNNEVTGSVFRIVLHALDDGVVNLRVLRDVSGFAHWQGPANISVKRGDRG